MLSYDISSLFLANNKKNVIILNVLKVDFNVYYFFLKEVQI